MVVRLVEGLEARQREEPRAREAPAPALTEEEEEEVVAGVLVAAGREGCQADTIGSTGTPAAG